MMGKLDLNCRECGEQFVLHSGDRKILDYFDAPNPTLCGVHSLQRRLAFRNECHLYRRLCELCGKEILAMYSSRSYVHVYCHDCWYSDQWDALSYAQDYDPSRSFIDQWYELARAVPHFNLWQVGTNTGCGYSNYIFSSKDCYLSSGVQSEGLVYCRNTDYSRDCTDCFNALKCELLYDCVNSANSYESAFLTRCEKCTNCYFCRDSQDCQQCFGCVSIHHKQYCWYDEQLSQEEYERRLESALKDRESFEIHRNKFEEFSKSLPVEYATIRTSEDATGDEILHSKSVRNSFFITDAENIGDSYRVAYGYKDVYRMSYGGIDGQIIYESLAMPHNSSCIGSFSLGDSSFLSYSCFSFNSQHLLGCVGIRKKSHCILNKQYTESQFDSLKKQIVSDMKERGEWGEFFPQKYSPFGYNDSVAYEFFEMRRDEALSRNWQWEDDQGGVTGKETIQSEHIAPCIAAVPESFTKELLRCSVCTLNYRIQKKELVHLKKLRIPIPLECHSCRFKKRMRRFFIPRLFERECMCDDRHSAHDGMKCTAIFQTTYRPSEKDSVYCAACYQECIH